MTPQEASEELKEEIEIFKNCIRPADWENPDEELAKIIEANTMAIELLGQQPCDDCISRTALLASLEKSMNWTDSEAELQEQRDYDGFIELIKNMQSVKPKGESEDK